jgi:uncharacterized protein YjbI with pentapeptide repeats
MKVQGADLTNADLRQAVCDGADFTGATLADETLARAVSWRGATLPDGSGVLVINDDNKAEHIPDEHKRLCLAYLTGTFADLNLDKYNVLGSWLTGKFAHCSFVEALFDYARLSGSFSAMDWTKASLTGASLSGHFADTLFNKAQLTDAALTGDFTIATFIASMLDNTLLSGAFSVVDFTETSLVQAHLSGVFTASQFDRANLTDATLSGIFANCSFKGADTQEMTIDDASLVGCDFTDAHLEETMLQRAQRLRGCTLPDGTPYDGRYNLPGDRHDAANYRYNLDDPDQRAEFYGSKRLKAR